MGASLGGFTAYCGRRRDDHIWHSHSEIPGASCQFTLFSGLRRKRQNGPSKESVRVKKIDIWICFGFVTVPSCVDKPVQSFGSNTLSLSSSNWRSISGRARRPRAYLADSLDGKSQRQRLYRW